MKWISVEDGLPPIGDRYHAVHHRGVEWDHGAFIGSWDEDFRRDFMKANGYTHWMPLPEPPCAN